VFIKSQVVQNDKKLLENKNILARKLTHPGKKIKKLSSGESEGLISKEYAKILDLFLEGIE